MSSLDEPSDSKNSALCKRSITDGGGVMDFGAFVSNTENSGLSIPLLAAIQINRESFPIKGNHIAWNVSPNSCDLGGLSQSVPWRMLQNPPGLSLNGAISQIPTNLGIRNLIPTDPQIHDPRQNEVKSMHQESDQHPLRLHHDLQYQSCARWRTAAAPNPIPDSSHTPPKLVAVPLIQPPSDQLPAAPAAPAVTITDAADAAHGNSEYALRPVPNPIYTGINDSPEAHTGPLHPPKLAESSLLQLSGPPPAAQTAPAVADADSIDVAKIGRGADAKRSRGRPRGSKDRQVLPAPAAPRDRRRRCFCWLSLLAARDLLLVRRLLPGAAAPCCLVRACAHAAAQHRIPSN